jgi:hypothetical protein
MVCVEPCRGHSLWATFVRGKREPRRSSYLLGSDPQTPDAPGACWQIVRMLSESGRGHKLLVDAMIQTREQLMRPGSRCATACSVAALRR